MELDKGKQRHLLWKPGLNFSALTTPETDQTTWVLVFSHIHKRFWCSCDWWGLLPQRQGNLGVFVFKTKTYCMALGELEFTMLTKMALNSQWSSLTCFLSSKIRRVCHPIWLDINDCFIDNSSVWICYYSICYANTCRNIWLLFIWLCPTYSCSALRHIKGLKLYAMKWSHVLPSKMMLFDKCVLKQCGCYMAIYRDLRWLQPH